MFAIREDRDYVIEEDFMKAARKIRDTKKLESKLDYQKVWFNYLLILLKNKSWNTESMKL